MQQINTFIDKYLATVHIPKTFVWTDIVEIIIISFLVYQILAWIRNTRTWALLRGVLVILGFLMVAAIFNMTTIIWIAGKIFSVAAIAIVVILQPELRRALEQLGQKNIFSSLLPFETAKVPEGRFSDKTRNEIIKACYEMGKVRTGALIVIEQNTPLAEYERTGIEVDGIVTSQLLINIFEHNTPLHDGAVIIRGNRVTWATCYQILSWRRLAKFVKPTKDASPPIVLLVILMYIPHMIGTKGKKATYPTSGEDSFHAKPPSSRARLPVGANDVPLLRAVFFMLIVFPSTTFVVLQYISYEKIFP